MKPRTRASASANRLAHSPRAVALAAAAAFVAAAAACGGEESHRRELDELRAENLELARKLRELERRLESVRVPTRSAIEDYLEDRGITGLAWTDSDLTPLDRVLRRATLGCDLRLRYEWLDNFYDLDYSDEEDLVDYAEIRARLSFGYVLAGGAEIEVELQALLPKSGLVEWSAFWSGMSPAVLGPEILLARSESFGVRRARLTLPSVNLFGRLARVPVTAVLGRQEIAFGSGFVMGRLDEEAGLTYDGVRVFGESGSGDRVDAFWGRAASGAGEVVARAGGDPVIPETFAHFPNVEIAGVRAQKRGLLQDTTAAAYLLGAWLGEVPADSVYPALPATTLNTLGVEASADVTANSVLRLEAACQWGEREDMTVENAAAAELSFEWRAEPVGGAVYFAFATGDRPHTDEVYEGFLPLAQDVRGRWDELGVLCSSNCYLWGVRGRFGDHGHDGRGAHATVSVTHAFADDPASRAGLFVYDPVPGGGSGKEIGFFISASAEGRIFGEEDSRARVSFTTFLPGGYFAGPADPATFLSFEMKMGF